MGLLIGETLPNEIVLDRYDAWTLDRETLAEVVRIQSRPNDEDTDLPSQYVAHDLHWTRQYEPRLGELRRLFSADDERDTSPQRFDW